MLSLLSDRIFSSSQDVRGTPFDDLEQGYSLLSVDDEDGLGNEGFYGEQTRLAIVKTLSHELTDGALAGGPRDNDGYVARARWAVRNGRYISQDSTADGVVLDYLPYLRAIIAAEDLEQRRYISGVAQNSTGTTRRTRNSRQTSFNRLVTVSEEMRGILAEGALDFGDDSCDEE